MQHSRVDEGVEQFQKSTSTALESEFAERSIDDCLFEIDTTTKVVPSDADDRSLRIGPFAVLDLRSPASLPSPVLPEGPEDIPLEPAIDHSSFAHLPDVFHANLNWSDLFEIGCMPHELGFSSSGFPSFSVVQDGSHSDPVPDQLLLQNGAFFQNIPPPQQVSLPSSGPAIGLGLAATDAQMLLKHFKNSTLAHMSSFPSLQKGPFYTLNLAAAIQTLAYATYLDTQTISHAALCNLLTLLAISANSLANTEAKQTNIAARWLCTGEELHERAKAHLRWSLLTELQGSQVAKYRDQLMAITALLGYAVRIPHSRRLFGLA